MERNKLGSPRTSESDVNSKLKQLSINRFIGVEKRLPGSIRFSTLVNTPEFSAVFINGRSYGFLLFFATTQKEVGAFYRETRKTILENPTEMIVDCPEISDEEISKRLPVFLQNYYPTLAKTLPLEKQVITPRILASRALQRS